jgi:hypothetical protein
LTDRRKWLRNQEANAAGAVGQVVAFAFDGDVFQHKAARSPGSVAGPNLVAGFGPDSFVELCFAPSQVQWFHTLERYGGSVRDDFAAKTKRTLEAPWVTFARTKGADG